MSVKDVVVHSHCLDEPNKSYKWRNLWFIDTGESDFSEFIDASESDSKKRGDIYMRDWNPNLKTPWKGGFRQVRLTHFIPMPIKS